MTKLSSLSSRLIASRVVFRHRARARHRGIDKSDQRAKSATTADPYPRTNSHLKGDSPLHAPTRPLAAPLAARRFPLAATRVPTRAFHVPTGNTSGATGNSCGDSRYRLGARGGNSSGRLGHQEGASRRGGRRLAAASRPGRGRLAAARCAAPLPRAPPLPPRSLPNYFTTLIVEGHHATLSRYIYGKKGNKHQP